MLICDYTPQLRQLMHQVNLDSLVALYQATGLPRHQIQRLRAGQAETLPMASLIKLSQVLQIPLSQLLELFLPNYPVPPQTVSPGQEVHALKAEYQRLQDQLEQQKQALEQQFQQTVLQTLEPLLLQWPTAAYAAKKNPQAPAVKILPLLHPLDQLLQSWGIEPIGAVGEETTYSPQWHQPLDPTIVENDPVQVRNVGYRRGEQLLYRAKVRAVP
ncbi:MAG: helix-turn-helix domain-containing protein [Thermosynechococcaceae cyanobacterium]